MRRIVALTVAVVAAHAMGVAADSNRRTLHARLAAANEVPVVVSPARGEFRADIDNSSGVPVISYELSYEGLEGDVLQAHIHAGQAGVNGGIMIWLCSNLASPPTPAGVQACPPAPATITGTIAAADVVGPSGQGIPAGDLDDALEAIQRKNAYVNVHSSVASGGELRGQIR